MADVEENTDIPEDGIRYMWKVKDVQRYATRYRWNLEDRDGAIVLVQADGDPVTID